MYELAIFLLLSTQLSEIDQVFIFTVPGWWWEQNVFSFTWKKNPRREPRLREQEYRCLLSPGAESQGEETRGLEAKPKRVTVPHYLGARALLTRERWNCLDRKRGNSTSLSELSRCSPGMWMVPVLSPWTSPNILTFGLVSNPCVGQAESSFNLDKWLGFLGPTIAEGKKT